MNYCTFLINLEKAQTTHLSSTRCCCLLAYNFTLNYNGKGIFLRGMWIRQLETLSFVTASPLPLFIPVSSSLAWFAIGFKHHSTSWPPSDTWSHLQAQHTVTHSFWLNSDHREAEAHLAVICCRDLMLTRDHFLQIQTKSRMILREQEGETWCVYALEFTNHCRLLRSIDVTVKCLLHSQRQVYHFKVQCSLQEQKTSPLWVASVWRSGTIATRSAA